MLYPRLVPLLILTLSLAACGGGQGGAPGQTLSAGNSSGTTTSAGTSSGTAEASPLETFRDEFSGALSQWRAAQAKNYKYAYKEGGDGYKFAQYRPIWVEVRDGEVVSLTRDGQALALSDYPDLTVDGLFARLTEQYASLGPDDRLSVEFDPILGVPEQALKRTGCCDGSTRMEVTDFTLLP